MKINDRGFLINNILSNLSFKNFSNISTSDTPFSMILHCLVHCSIKYVSMALILRKLVLFGYKLP